MEISIYIFVLFAAFFICYGLAQLNLEKPDEDFRRVDQSTILFDLFKPLIQIMGVYNQRIISEKTEEKFKHKLQISGNPFNLIAPEFLAVKQLAAISGALFGLFLVYYANSDSLFILFLTAFGFVLPDITLTQAIRKRKLDLFRELPNAMDLLVLSMEAGLSFSLAVEKVVQNGAKSELNTEFNRLLRDIKLGLTMREALRGLAARTDMYEIRTFVTALIQADTLGSPIAEVLRVQAELRRTERFQRAEKLAQEAPVKILFPLLFFIFPAVFIIILTPIALQFMQKGM